ncbi:MAG: DUF4340 domain-containing protein, partial [Ruminococcaceae bacterium]|nr:DUF4340 domain-containing protein [Oscillospiraceae bacterium]
PFRRGYRFEGWYIGEDEVRGGALAGNEDMRLIARWSRVKSKDQKKSMLKRQKIALFSLTVCAVLLSVILVGVLNLISIYSLTDTYVVDGVEYSDKYTIKKHNGIYRLFDEDGVLMEQNMYEGDRNIYIAKKSGNQYEIDEETGDYKQFIVVDTEGLEVAPGTNLLMYAQISSTDIYSITVTHKDADTPAYRFLNEGDGVYIEGFKDSLIAYDENKFAYLCMSCGYTSTQMKLDATSKDSTVPRLENGKIDYAVYGLDQPQATFTVSAIKDKKADVYEADPKRTFTVLIGDRTLSDSGFYVKLKNSDSVYILSSTYIEESVLKPVEELIVPDATHPVTVNQHTMVQDFYLTYLENWIDTENIKGTPVVAFDYEEMEYRQNTLMTTTPFICDSDLLEGMSGYAINDGKASDALGSLYSMEYLGCRAIGVKNNPALLAEFGLDKNVFYLTYKTKTGKNDKDGNPLYATNDLIISQKTKEGTHFVASLAYDMIVEVDQYYLSFLEWGHFEWYNQYFMSADVAYLKEIDFDFGDGKLYNFTLNNDLTYAYYHDTKEKYSFKATDKVMKDKYGNYWISVDGGKERRLQIIDFDGMTRLSHEEADKNSGVGNILYQEDIFYYYNSDQKIVRITPDYAAGDSLIEKDGVYYYVAKGSNIAIDGGKTTGALIYRFKDGTEVELNIGSTGLLLICEQYDEGRGDDKHLMDYQSEHTYVNDNGVTVTETFSATDNFRNLYMQILQYSLRGDIDEKEFKRNTGLTVEQFLAGDRADQPDVTVTMEVEDYARILNDSVKYDSAGDEYPVHAENITRRLVFRFYRYSDMKAMLTIEAMEQNEDGSWKPSTEEVRGRFFVSAAVLDKLEADVERLQSGEFIDKTVKH